MAGVGQKLRIIEEALGEWYKVDENRYVNLEGKYLLYNESTNRLLIDGVLIMMEDGKAILNGKMVKFSHLREKTWGLSKRPIFKQHNK